MPVILLIALGFIMAAFFSGAETALVSINWIRLEHWLEKGRGSARRSSASWPTRTGCSERRSWDQPRDRHDVVARLVAARAGLFPTGTAALVGVVSTARA